MPIADWRRKLASIAAQLILTGARHFLR